MLTSLDISHHINKALSTLRGVAPELLRDAVVARVTSVPPANMREMALAIWDGCPPARPVLIEMRVSALLQVARAIGLPDAVFLLERAAREALRCDHALTWGTLREVADTDLPDALLDGVTEAIRMVDQLRKALP